MSGSAGTHDEGSNESRLPESCFEEGEVDHQAEASILGLQSYWDSTYAEDLANFQERGDPGEIWFGEDVTERVATWTSRLCVAVAGGIAGGVDPIHGLLLGYKGVPDRPAEGSMKLELDKWRVLDIGTGNGIFLHALSKQGFSDLTGTDYSDAAVVLAQAVAKRDGFSDIKFVVDDVLDTKLSGKYNLVIDKGTFDAIGLHPDGASHRSIYWRTISKLIAPGGVLVLTSCNSTKDELVNEVNSYFECSRSNRSIEKDQKSSKGNGTDSHVLEYLDHVRTYPTFKFAGKEGSRVSTVAFALRKSRKEDQNF